MMQHDLHDGYYHYHQYVESKTGTRQWPKVALGVLGGVLYVVAALAVMQVAFLVWIGAW